MNVAFHALGLAFVGHAGAAYADSITIEIVDWGVTNPRALKEKSAPDTTSGFAWEVEDPPEVLRTDTINACPGVHFGVRYRASRGLMGASAPVTIEVRHPPFTAPSGNGRTVDPV